MFIIDNGNGDPNVVQQTSQGYDLLRRQIETAINSLQQRLGRATQALPNGYCGLPVQKSCPHANACLTCPVFLTGPGGFASPVPHRRRSRPSTGSG